MTIEETDALIVVDLQNDFCPGGALPIEGGDRIVPMVNRLIHSIDLVFFTRDWHPQDHCSFDDTPEFRDGSWPEHCVQYSPGAEFQGSLHVPMDARIISKGTDPDTEEYSGFANPALDAELKRRGITRVFVCGLATDYCVKATALDALRAGYATVVLEDAVRGVAEDTSAAALAALAAAGAQVCRAEEVL